MSKRIKIVVALWALAIATSAAFPTRYVYFKGEYVGKARYFYTRSAGEIANILAEKHPDQTHKLRISMGPNVSRNTEFLIITLIAIAVTFVPLPTRSQKTNGKD